MTRHDRGTTQRVLKAASLLLASLLVGCQEVSFKAGATPGDFSAARARCQRDDATAYAACMRELGYFVATPGSGGLLGAQDDFEAAYAADLAEQERDADADSDEADVTPVQAATAPDAAVVETGPAAAGAPTAAPGASASGPDPRPRPKSAPPGPVAIGSWWKLGGSTDELARVRAACEAREPPGTVLSDGDARVTWSLRRCMRAQGWVGIVRR